MGKSMENFTEQKNTLGLYDPQFEHDACGIGAVVDIKGRKSHQTVDDALAIVERLEHRAGKDAEGKTGDGVGILLQISHKFFSKVAEELNISLGNEREYGVGMFFFPQSEHLRAQAMKLFEVVTRKEGLEFLAWRKVPVNPDAVGQKARDCMPAIWQCFIKKPAKVSKGIDFDRKLYIVRRVFEQASNGTYVPSLSSRTIVYKGMFLVHDRPAGPRLRVCHRHGAQPLLHQHQPQLDARTPQPLHPAQRRDQHHQGQHGCHAGP